MGYDAIVIGGGPAGCFFSGNLARKGWKVIVLEEHRKIGYPWCCAGVVGVGGMEELGIALPKSLILEKLEGALLYSPTGKKVELTRGKVEAWVIDRPAFDQFLADMAVKEGAEISIGLRCRGVEGTKAKVGNRVVEGKVIVGADGPVSIVAKQSGLEKKRNFMRFAQVEAKAETTAHFAEIYFGREVAPGFFGWVVPAGEKARIGVGTYQNPLPFLRNLLGKLERRIRGRIPKPSVDVIKTTRPTPAGEHVVLVGDAAGHVKPLTKGGLYVGLTCAKLAAETVSNYLEGKRKLEAYAHAVKEKFGQEFRWGDFAFSFYSRLGDGMLERMLEMLSRKKIKNFILRHADFDHHSSLLRKLPLLAAELI